MSGRKGQHNIGRPPQKESASNLRHAPIRSMDVLKNGQIRPLTYLSDVRWVSGSFLLSLQKAWDEHGDKILKTIAETTISCLDSTRCTAEILTMVMSNSSGCERLEERTGLTMMTI
jgi:hypothetical protein